MGDKGRDDTSSETSGTLDQRRREKVGLSLNGGIHARHDTGRDSHNFVLMLDLRVHGCEAIKPVQTWSVECSARHVVIASERCTLIIADKSHLGLISETPTCRWSVGIVVSTIVTVCCAA